MKKSALHVDLPKSLIAMLAHLMSVRAILFHFWR